MHDVLGELLILMGGCTFGLLKCNINTCGKETGLFKKNSTEHFGSFWLITVDHNKNPPTQNTICGYT